MTGKISILFLFAILVMAGCSAKNTPHPAKSFPENPSVATEDAGAANQDLGQEPAADDDSETVETAPLPEELPETAVLTPEEQRILEADTSLHVGLDTKENKDVQRYFIYFSRQKRGTFEAWLKRAQVYLPYMRDRFKAEGLPEDLIYLPFAESGFNPFAYSRAGACGVWQFMPATGGMYGLSIDAWVDERRDPYESTEAAIKYLKRLYAQFGDWYLALAAYNAGEGTIDRAMKKTGCEDYFALCASSTDIKDETRLYVPKFLALVKIARNLETLGFKSVDWNHRPSYAKVHVPADTNLQELAQNTGLSWKTFHELNPIFRTQQSPGNRAVKIALPGDLVAKAEEYISRPKPPKIPKVQLAKHTIKPGDSWVSISKKYGVSMAELKKLNAKAQFKNGVALNVPTKAVPASVQTALKDTQKYATTRANYVARSGETVWSIAKQFKVDPASLLQANGMKSPSELKLGQKLYIPDAGTAATKVAAKKAETVRENLTQYTVKNGDTLWNIAQRFGVSPVDIRKWNKLAENTAIKPGDSLKVMAR